MIQLEKTYWKYFTTHALGRLDAPTSGPTGVLYRNGAATAVSVTFTAIATGVYKATFTTLGAADTWAKTDSLSLYVTASIGGNAGYSAFVWDSDTDPDAVMRGTDAVPNSTIQSIYTVVQLTDADVSSIRTTVEGIVAGVWSAATRTLTAIGDSSGITTLLNRVTALLQTKEQADTNHAAVLTAIDAIDPGGSGTGEIIAGVLAGLPQPVVTRAPTLERPGRFQPILRGCDYRSIDGLALTVTVSSAVALTGASVALTATRNGFTIAGTGTITAHETLADRWVIAIDLTAAATTKPAGDYTCDIVATLPTNNRKIGLAHFTLPLLSHD